MSSRDGQGDQDTGHFTTVEFRHGKDTRPEKHRRNDFEHVRVLRLADSGVNGMVDRMFTTRRAAMPVE